MHTPRASHKGCAWPEYDKLHAARTHCGEQHCLLNHARLRLLLGLVTPVLGCSSLVASNAAFRTGCSMLSPAARHVALMLHSGLVSLVAVEAAHRPRRGESTSVVSPAPRGTPAACVLCKSTRHDPAHVAWSRREENIARKASGFASLDAGQHVGQKPPTSGRWEAIYGGLRGWRGAAHEVRKERDRKTAYEGCRAGLGSGPVFLLCGGSARRALTGRNRL